MLKFIVSMLFLVILFGCETSTASVVENDLDKDEVIIINEMNFFRTNAKTSNAESVSVVIDSYEEFYQFINEQKKSYQFEHSDFDSYAGEYFTESFFETHSLVIFTLFENSGSIRHSYHNHNLVNGLLTVELNRTVPEILTWDMAEWHLIIEIEKSDSEIADLEVILIP